MTEGYGNAAGDGVGDELSRARAALGFSVADVAQQLKFAPRQIEALEQGRYEELPAGTFARGMVRAYARLLRLDPEPLVQRIARRVAVPDNADAVASARRPIPITDSARRTNLVYAALSLALLAVIAGVMFEWRRERTDPARLTFVPAAAQAPAPKEPAQLASSAVSVGAMAIGPGGVAAPEAAAAPAVPAADPAATPAEGVRRLHLKYERDSWVEIHGRGDKLLTSRLNAGGTEQVVEGRPPFSLVIGNAQHVSLTYDDQPIDLAPYVKVEVARFTLD
ncbi:MAG TPA: helix-turn-helix domain-containing protein [Burkholderiales bacterium]|jgi:cytoskeleton protein RodZ|nr:helix-turn-helix domain-containing protein [Burkholderiales bacterium]